MTCFDIAFCAFYILLFTIIILKTNLFTLLPKQIEVGEESNLKRIWHGNGLALAAFYLKLLFGVALWYIYAYHYKNRYTSDIFKYFDDGKLMFNVIHTNTSDFFKMLTGIADSNDAITGYYHSMKSWVNGHDSTLYNNSHFIIRLNAFFMFLSMGHYGVHVIFMCFISFLGLTFLYKAFYPYLSDKALYLFAAIFLFPSVLLWSSGILKEGLVFLGLGMMIYYFKAGTQMTQKDMINTDENTSKFPNTSQKKISEDHTHQRHLRSIASPRHLRSIVFILLGAIILFEAKAYVLLCIIPGFIAEFIISKSKSAAKHPWLTYIAVTVVYLLIGLNINLVYPALNPIKTIADKQTEFMRLNKGGIYLALASDETQYAYVPVNDSVNIIPTNSYADSLLHKKGIQFLTSSAFCYQEEISKHIAPYRLKPGMHFDMVRMREKDTLHLIADSAIYRLDTYIEPAKSAIAISPMRPTLYGLISFVPQALVISFIRPFPHEISSAAILIYFCENVLLFLLIIFVLIFRKKANIYTNVVAFCVSYSLLMLILIGISTPVYGGIERYKSVVIPFMLILLLLIYDKDRFKRTKNNEHP